MRNIAAIAWKETKAYAFSPMAFVIASVFLAFTGVVFVLSISTPFPEASVRGYISPAAFFLIILSPVITMRLLAEEQKLGTLELLLTAPVRDFEVVLGKYVASLLIIVGTIALTFFYVLLLYWFGDPDTGTLLSSYLGLILYAAATLAIGLFASSLTGNQIVSAVVAIGAIVILSFIHQVGSLVTGWYSLVLVQLSLNTHFDDFYRGVIDSGNVIYY
ncbi:MAG: ABC transporter permease subunit, partial [Chloroflexi bacterium]|nr:ABC transporter permease subunit [Chloroflexota bacterium]